MGLRCSILGHEFGDAELQREREERGDEVVVTIREVRACERCGVEHVESESTEVRPVEPAGTAADDPADGTAGEGTDPDADADAGGDADADTEFADDPASAAGSGGVGTAAVEEAETPAPEEDDGIILGDDEGGSSERPAGEWPRADDTRLDEHDRPPEQDASTGTETGTEAGSESGPDDDGGAPGAETETEAETEIPDAGADGDEGADPDENGDVDLNANVEGTESEDAEILGGAPGSDPRGDAVSGNGESGAQSDARSVTAGDDWPEHDDTPDEGSVAENGDGSGIDTEFSGLAPGGDPEASTGDRSRAPAVADSVSLDATDGTVFVCGECGFSEPIERSSLRAGDICPDCRAGYLHEVAPDEK